MGTRIIASIVLVVIYLCNSIYSCFTDDLPSGTYLAGDNVIFDLDSILEGEDVQCVVNSSKMLDGSVLVVKGGTSQSIFDTVLPDEYLAIYPALTGDLSLAYTHSSITVLRDGTSGPTIQKSREFSPLNVAKVQVASEIYVLLQDPNTGEIRLQVLDWESLVTKRDVAVDTFSKADIDPLVAKFAVGDKKTSSIANLVVYSTGEAKLAIFQDNQQQTISRGYFALKRGNIQGLNQEWTLLKLTPIYDSNYQISVILLVSNPTSGEKLVVRCSLADGSLKLVCDQKTYSLGELPGQQYFSPGDWPSRYALSESRLLPDIVSLNKNILSVFKISNQSSGYSKIEEFSVSGIDDIYGLYSPTDSQYLLYVELSNTVSENEKFGLVRIRLQAESTDVIKTPNTDKDSLVVPRILANGSLQVTLVSKTQSFGYLFQKNQITVNTGIPGLASTATLSVECSCLSGNSSKSLSLDLLKNTGERHRLRLPYTVSGPCGSKYVGVPVDAKSTSANSPEIKFFNTTVPGLVSPSEPLHNNLVGSLHIYDGRDSKARKNVTFNSLSYPYELSENRILVFNEEGLEYLILSTSIWTGGVQLNLEGVIPKIAGFELLAAKEYTLKQEEANQIRVLLLWTNSTHTRLEARSWKSSKTNYTVTVPLKNVNSGQMELVSDGIMLIVTTSGSPTSSGTVAILRIKDEDFTDTPPRPLTWTPILSQSLPEKLCPLQVESIIDHMQNQLIVMVSSRCQSESNDKAYLYYLAVDMTTQSSKILQPSTIFTLPSGARPPIFHIGKDWIYVIFPSVPSVIGMPLFGTQPQLTYPLKHYYNATEFVCSFMSKHSGLLQILAKATDEEGKAITRNHVFRSAPPVPQSRVHSIYEASCNRVFGIIRVSGGLDDQYLSVCAASRAVTGRFLYLNGPHFGVNFEKLTSTQSQFRFNWTIGMPGTPRREETAPHWVQCYDISKTINMSLLSPQLLKLPSNGTIYEIESKLQLSGHYRKAIPSSPDILFTERSIKIQDIPVDVGVTRVVADYSYLMLVRNTSIELIDLDESTSIGSTPVQGDVLDTGFYRDTRIERTKIYFASFRSRGRVVHHVGTCKKEGIMNVSQIQSPLPRCEGSIMLVSAQPFLRAPDALRLELMVASYCGSLDQKIRVYIQPLKAANPSPILTLHPQARIVSMELVSLNTTEGDCLLIYQTDRSTLSTFVWIKATDQGPSRMTVSTASSIVPNEVLNYDDLPVAGFRCKLVWTSGYDDNFIQRKIRCLFPAATPYSYISTHVVNLNTNEPADLIKDSVVEAYLLPVLNYKPIQASILDGFSALLLKHSEGTQPNLVVVYSNATNPIPGTPSIRAAFRLYYPEDLGALTSDVKHTTLYSTFGTDKNLAVRLAAVAPGNLRLQYLNFLTCGVRATTNNFTGLSISFLNEDSTATELMMSSLFSVPRKPAPPAETANPHVLPLMLCVGLLFVCVLGVFCWKFLLKPSAAAAGDESLSDAQKELSID